MDGQVHAEELQALLKLYEKNGYFDELISLLESGLGKLDMSQGRRAKHVPNAM